MSIEQHVQQIADRLFVNIVANLVDVDTMALKIIDAQGGWNDAQVPHRRG